MAILSKILNFIQRDVWRIRSSQLPKGKSFWIKQLRIFLLAIRGFDEDKCQLRASALTYYSLLSIVPVVAMLFALAKGFGFENRLEVLLLEKLPGQEEVISQVIGFARSFIENTKASLIAGVGIAGLFWAIIKALGNIESSFNDIWGIKKARSIGRKFSDYLSVMLICPILLIMSSSMTVLITGQVQIIMEKISLLGIFSPIITLLLKLLPYCVLWTVFTFLYIFMPNTKINFKSGLLGGVVGGTIYQLVQWAYITFQIGASKFGAIYGSFAALPLFLIWVQLSWLVVLFGAEVSFAEQNVDTYEFEPDCLEVSNCFKRILTLRIAHMCIKNFQNASKPLSATDISHQLEMPIRLARQILFELVEAGVLIETKSGDDKLLSYTPVRDIEPLTIRGVIRLLDHKGTDDIPVSQSKELDEIKSRLKAFGDLLEKSPANIPLKDI